MNSNNYDTRKERGSLSDFDKSGKRGFSPNFNQPRSKSRLWLWIILGLVLVSGLGLGIYFFTKSSDNSPTKNPNNPNIQYLPSQQEAQTKISQIQQAKGLDEQQATIEFLTAYVPHIKWWEINSLSELDEKINLVNNKMGFPPFSEIPKVKEFNERAEQNFTYKSLLFMASIIPRESDGKIDWKGLDYHTYIIQVLKPLEKEWKFKPGFATQENFNELGRRIKQEVNSSVASLCSQWVGLTKVEELNDLTTSYLSKIFFGYVYSEIQDSLGEQLGITNHDKFRIQKTDNASVNEGWRIALNEFAFKGGNQDNPDSPINPPSSNPQIKQLQDQAEEIRQLLKSCQPSLNSFEQTKKSKEDLITQLETQKQNLDPNDREYNIKSMDLETQKLKIQSDISEVELSKDKLEKIRKDIDHFETTLANCRGDNERNFEGWIPNFQQSFSVHKTEILSLKKTLEDF